MGDNPFARRRPWARTGLSTPAVGPNRGRSRHASRQRGTKGIRRRSTAYARGGAAQHRPQAGHPLTVFDAQAIIAFLLDEPAAVDVERHLRDESQPARISAVNLGEVIDVMTRIFGRAHHETTDALILLESGGLRIADVDADLGIEAGQLHAKHYHRTSSPLSMADCVALATAVVLHEPIATSDPPLAAAARAEGVTVIALPDSKRRRPE